MDLTEINDQGNELTLSACEHTEPSAAIQRTDAAKTDLRRPNFYWTWKLLADGYSLDEVLQVRNLDRETALQHSLRAVEDQLPVQPAWILSETKQVFLTRFVEQHPNQRPAQLLNSLPAGVTAQELLFFLGCQSTVNQETATE